jgi:chromodomain-helicase-DNA-binding protein 4
MGMQNEGSFAQDKKRAKSSSPPGSSYNGSDQEDIEMDSDGTSGVEDETLKKLEKENRKKPLGPIHNTTPQVAHDCGLCGLQHTNGQCIMVERSENLAEYREMLILHAEDEPWDERVCVFCPFWE